MKHAAYLTVLVAGLAVAVNSVRADELDDMIRQETQAVVSELVGELHRRESELVQSKAREQAVNQQFEALKGAVSGGTVARSGALGDASSNLDQLSGSLSAVQAELVGLKKQVAVLVSERDAALADRDRARAETESVKRHMDRQVLSQKQDLERQQAELRELMEANRRERVTLSYNIGCVYKASKQYAKAESEFLKALALAPNDPGLHYNLGVLYDDCLNDTERARKHYRQFLELAPEDADAAYVVEWLSALQ